MSTVAAAQHETVEDFENSVGRWLAEIKAYDRVFRDWEADVKRVNRRYRNEGETSTSGERGKSKRFSILWSTVQTMQPAIYSKRPSPDISRAKKDKDQIGRVSAMILERCVRDQVERDGQFHEALLGVRDDYLLGARGQAWVRYIPTFDPEETVDRVALQEVEQNSFVDPSDLSREIDSASVQRDDEGPFVEDRYRAVVQEIVEVEHLTYDQFGHTPAPKWSKVRAVWKKELLTRDQLVERFGKVGREVSLNHRVPGTGDDQIDDKFGDAFKRALVYEIWDKPSRKVIWVSPGYTEDVLDEIDDPLHLEGFFPCPKPLYGTMTTDSLIPVPDYEEWRTQAEEIDRLTMRIHLLTKALKVAGAYNGTFPELEKIIKSQDNILVPVEDWAGFSDQGGTEGAISWFPVEEVAKTLRLLMEVRDQMKQDMFEVSGVSDIIRGQSTAGTPASATEQRIKGQYAGLRLEDRQQRMAVFASEVIQIIAEIIAEHFDEATIREISGWENTEEARSLQEAWEQQVQAGPPLPAGQGGVEQGAPPQAPPPTHPDQVFMAAVQMMRNDKLRGYNIDISTDTLVLEDRQIEKQARIEFIQASTQFLREAVPATEQYPEMFPVLAEMMMFGVRGFKTGRHLEQVFETMNEQTAERLKNPQPKPEQEKLQQEAQQAQAELQLKSQEIKGRQEAEMARLQQDMQIEAARIEIDRARLELDREKLRIEAARSEPQDTSAADQHARDVETVRLDQEIKAQEADISIRERELGLREAELGLKAKEFGLSVAGHNKQLMEEAQEPEDEDNPRSEPTAVPVLADQITSGLDKTMGAVIERMAEMQKQAIQRQDDLIRELAAAQREQTETIVAALSAPKRVVRDETGRVAGVE